MKKGDRVLVTWLDIKAALHTEEDIEPVKAQSVGWIETYTKKYIRLRSSYYPDDHDFPKLADKIAIPRGCVESIEKI